MNNWSSIYHIPPRRNLYKYMNLPRHGGSTPSPNRSQPRKCDNAALQSHVAFFDTDDDGVIWPSDTFAGLRVLGLGVLFSIFAMLLIHGSLSWVTSGALLPDPFFRLKIKNMHRVSRVASKMPDPSLSFLEAHRELSSLQGKHGSDSEAYTSTGAFDEERFNYVFNMYSSEPHTHMTFNEGINMLHGNRNAFDPFGWMAAALEWLTTYLVLWPKDGKMKKEDVRAIYDGSLFYKVSGRSLKRL